MESKYFCSKAIRNNKLFKVQKLENKGVKFLLGEEIKNIISSENHIQLNNGKSFVILPYDKRGWDKCFENSKVF